MKKVELPKIPIRRAVLALAPYNAPKEGRTGKLRLDFNENTVGCSPAVLRALSRITAEQMAIYPEYQATTQRLAQFFRVRTEEVHLTNGIDDALHLIADTFIEKGDTVLVAEPTFDMYRFFAELAGASAIALRYDKEMKFPVAEIVRTLSASARDIPRVLFIANPNNPTGTLVRPKDLRQILRAATKTLVLVDEAYFDFSGLTILPWIRSIQPDRRAHIFEIGRPGGIAYWMPVRRAGNSLGNAARVHTVPRKHCGIGGSRSFSQGFAFPAQLYARSFAKPRDSGKRTEKSRRACLSQRGKFRSSRFRPASAQACPLTR